MKRIFKATQVAILLSLFPASSAFALHYQGPLVVDANYIKKHGNVISGNYQGTTAYPAISITNAPVPVVIANANLTGPGDLIYATNSNVSVSSTTGLATNPNVANTSKGMFIRAINPIKLSVNNCSANGVSTGVSVTGYSGNYSPTQTISILNNKFVNIDGRPSNGSGGYVTSGSFNAHGIIISNVNNLPAMEIAWNEIDNTPFASQSAEVIESVSASGTSTSHFTIHDNYVQGAYPASPGTDNYSGGGIMINGSAKDTAATTSAYTDVTNNQVVSTSNMGIAIAAGHNNTVTGNRVVSSGYVGLGTKNLIAFSSAIGMYNWNYYNQAANVFFGNSITGNVIGLIRKNNSGSPERADTWLPGQTGGNNTSFLPNNAASPTIVNEAAEYASWLIKLANHNKFVGNELS